MIFQKQSPKASDEPEDFIFTPMNNIIIINDCRDENAAGRQIVRATHLFGSTPTFIGVTGELDAAGNLIDALDALDGAQGVILVNVAPRHGEAKKWENGTPFGYFYHGKTLVASTIDGPVLGLAKKLKLCESIRVLDTAQATDAMVAAGYIPAEIRDRIVKSQFRSFDFLPRIAAYITATGAAIGEEASIETFPDVPSAVWHVDNFGNCKTTLFSDEIEFSIGTQLKTSVGDLMCHARLKDVPHDEPALIIGSSGLGDRRFLEIVVQGRSAAKQFGLAVGDSVIS